MKEEEWCRWVGGWVGGWVGKGSFTYHVVADDEEGVVAGVVDDKGEHALEQIGKVPAVLQVQGDDLWRRWVDGWVGGWVKERGYRTTHVPLRSQSRSWACKKRPRPVPRTAPCSCRSRRWPPPRL